MKREVGYTLLELIVVIGIFAIFAAMAYGGLESVLKTRVGVEQALTRTESYDRAYLRMRADFQGAASRIVRDNAGDDLPLFFFDTYNRRVEFTRSGWQNLLSFPRSTFERVSYVLDDSQPKGASRARIEDKRLVRRSWLVLDRAPQTEPQELVLLDHVEDLNWRFLDNNKVWQDTWPAGDAGNAIGAATQTTPLAVEIKLKTEDWGEMKFLFRVGAEGAAQLTTLGKTPPPTPGGSGATTAGATAGTTTGTTTGTTGGLPPPPPPGGQETE